MNRNELELKVQENSGFTSEDFFEMLRFFSSLEEIDCGIIDIFYSFALKSVHTKFAYERLESIHEVTLNLYEKSKECPSLWKLDFLEIYYYYFIDSLTEVLRHANHILTLNTEGVDKCGAYSFAIMVFFRHKMINQAASYIDEADIYLKNNTSNLKGEFQLLINELDIYAISHQHKKYIATKDRLDSLMEEFRINDDYKMEVDFYNLHTLYGKVLLRDQFALDENKSAKEFKEILADLRKWKDIGENYGSLLTPLFDYFKDFFKKEEFIDEISHVITYNMNVNERLVLFQYLFETVKIDKVTYHDIYESYVENLLYYYTNTQKNKSSEILTEILNFSLEKKLDVLNAKYHYDTLTGCYNRVFLSEIEEQVLETGDVVIYLDLNDFKKINDTYGHDTGDKQLKIFAEILMRHFENDVVLRLGGDEFVVLTRGVPEDVLAKLDEARAEYLTHNLLKNRYGFSAGVLLPHGMAVHEAIGEADKAMYDSKKTGLPCIIREV